MNKKKWFAVLFVLVGISGFLGYKLFGPATQTSQGEFFYIPTGSTMASVKKDLVDKKYIGSPQWFSIASKLLKFKNVKPGRYKISKGMSMMKLVRMFRSGAQTPVSFPVTKIRTKEGLAMRIGKSFECDSAAMMNYLLNGDSLRAYGLDTNTVMASVLPFTYSVNWNATPQRIFEEFHLAYKKFWNAERMRKADSLQLSPIQVITLASIVEEETNKKQDKYNIASTYLNRMRIGMKLQADPTVIYALRGFGMKRVTGVHLKTDSPFNTYLYPGLPPGPICTPSIETIEAVLDAPATEYLYFVASHKFDGTSVFTTDYDDHLKFARLYQQELTRRMDSVNKAKQNK